MSKPNVYTVVLVRPECLNEDSNLEPNELNCYVAIVVALKIKDGVQAARDEVLKIDRKEIRQAMRAFKVKPEHYRVAAIFEGTCNQVGYSFDNF